MVVVAVVSIHSPPLRRVLNSLAEGKEMKGIADNDIHICPGRSFSGLVCVRARVSGLR